MTERQPARQGIPAGAEPSAEAPHATGLSPLLRLGTLLDLSRDPFIETDAAGVLTEWNRQAEIVFGWSRDEVIGRHLSEFLVPTRHVESFSDGLAIARCTPQTERTRPRDVRLLHRAGHEINMTTTAYVVGTGEDMRIGGFLFEGSDQAAEQTLAHVYLHDSLTGLPNRTLFTYRLTYSLARNRAVSRPVAVVALDLDRFKAINDGLGYEVGDEVLVEVARRLACVGGAAEVIARLGGDEFLVLFDGDDASTAAHEFAERALDVLAAPMALDGSAEVFLSASIGIAIDDAAQSEPAPLLSNADAAMYQAKRRGGRRIEVFGEQLRMHLVDRMTTEHSLHRAIERHQFELYYQPVVDIRDDTPVATEALLRWRHPEHGLLGPERFVAIAEESGLIVPMGAWALNEACRQLRSWQQGPGSGPFGAVEVNLAACQIDHPDIVDTVSRALADSGLAAEHLTLEITESTLMHDPRSALAVLRQLKDLGVMLAIDDFGTGYSSLGYLQRFPLDILKVDRCFVEELGVDPDATQIVAAVIGLAHALGLQVVAEGVESERQLEELRLLHCDFAQGFLFARPLPAGELVTVPAAAGRSRHASPMAHLAGTAAC